MGPMPSPGTPPPKKLRPPREYLRGEWPSSRVRNLADGEGGAAVEHMVEQVARLAAELAKRREQRGLNRHQLARLAGLRPNTVSGVEDGKSWPDLRTVTAMLWVLEMDLELEPRYSLRSRDPR